MPAMVRGEYGREGGAGAGRELVFVSLRLFNEDGRQLLPRTEGGKGAL
jgi:hypothetical protein